MTAEGEKKKGLVIVYTGNGKGKTTAAMGMLLRAWGRDMKVAAIQFIKDKDSRYGEAMAAERMGMEIIQVGDGCTWKSKDMNKTIACGLEGWELAKKKILEPGYNIILLDEFIYPLRFGWIDVGEVITWLQQHKPPDLHLVITGREAPQALIDYADLVTEMLEVKHPFREQKLPGQAGVDY